MSNLARYILLKLYICYNCLSTQKEKFCIFTIRDCHFEFHLASFLVVSYIFIFISASCSSAKAVGILATQGNMLTTLLSIGVYLLKCSLPFFFAYFNPSNISKPWPNSCLFYSAALYWFALRWHSLLMITAIVVAFVFVFSSKLSSRALALWLCSKFQGVSLFCWHSRSMIAAQEELNYR